MVNYKKIEPIALFYREQAQKQYRRFIGFSFALLMAHVLDLKPNQYSELGFSITIADQRILYGFIASFVVYNFVLAIYYELFSNSILAFDLFEHLKNGTQKQLKSSYPHYDDKQIKALSATMLFLANAVIIPSFVIIFLLGLLSLIVGGIDIHNFIWFIFEKYFPPSIYPQ